MKTYTIGGKTYNEIPDPLELEGAYYSPMTEARFVALGGTIQDDGELTPKEKFLSGLGTYLEALEKKAREEYALNITVSEFKQAAATMMSAELIAWAKGKGVPDKMIEDVRADILVMIADASRLGLTWADIFPEVSE